VTVAGGLPVDARTFNLVVAGDLPSNPFAGQLRLDTAPDDGVVPYLYGNGQWNLFDETSKLRQLARSDGPFTANSETADTVVFDITGLSSALAHMLRLNIVYSTTGSGTPLLRFGFRINATVVNTTASGPGFAVNAGTDVELSILVAKRTGGINLGFFQSASGGMQKLGISASVPTEIITDLRLTAQMLGASRSVTVNHYELWEFR